MALVNTKIYNVKSNIDFGDYRKSKFPIIASLDLALDTLWFLNTSALHFRPSMFSNSCQPKSIMLSTNNKSLVQWCQIINSVQFVDLQSLMKPSVLQNS